MKQSSLIIATLAISFSGLSYSGNHLGGVGHENHTNCPTNPDDTVTVMIKKGRSTFSYDIAPTCVDKEMMSRFGNNTSKCWKNVDKLLDKADKKANKGQQNKADKYYAEAEELAATCPLATARFEAEDYVDQSGVEVECYDPSSSGGCNVGYIDDGDWTLHKLDLTPSHDFSLNHVYTLRIAYSQWRDESGHWMNALEQLSGETSDIELLFTGNGIYDWKIVEVPFTIDSTDGSVEFMMGFFTGSVNVDYFELIP